MEDIKAWISNCCGRGYGWGDGSGYANGAGYADGYGTDDGYGYDTSFNSGDGLGNGSGRGCGLGYGWGDGSGYANGAGYTDGLGIKINRKEVYQIDKTQTIVTRIKGNLAKGFILNDDLSLDPCYIVKGNGYFAHGKTLEDARSALQDKIFSNMDTDEAIDMFLDTFEKGKAYKGTQFFEWHHYLTGSCLMGRESFVKNKNLDLNELYTVEEFIEICENAYGGEIIKELKERWKNE